MSGSAEEVVTWALVRFVDLPGPRPRQRLALLTLDNGLDHTRPSTFGPAGLAALEAALDEVAASDAVAVAVTGKPYVFAVGADLTLVASITTREQALAVARAGHATFRRLGELGRPTFAYLNGAALGGGLELALHCTYRTVSSGARSLGLPEVALGLVPGWGGAYLLPNLVGADAAVRMAVEDPLDGNRTLTGPQARGLGVADAMFSPADFLEESLRWSGAVLRGEVPVDRPEPDRGAAWEEAIGRGCRAADAKVRGAAPAPYRALDLLAAAATAGRDAAFAAEDEALADLLMSEELRSGLYAFDLVQRRARRPAGGPDPGLARPVTSVGVVGAGLMATQLALLAVRRLEVPVVLSDVDQERVDRGVAAVRSGVDALLAKGRVSPDQANRLRALVRGSVGTAAFAGADLVIEAVFEDLAVKREVLAGLEAVVSPGCLLATNTSALSVTAMAEGLEHPERVLGLHFFNPVAVLPLLEVVRGGRTDDAAVATGLAVGKALGKSCVLVRDAPAFVVNRLLTRLLVEVLAAVDAGTPLADADAALDDLGLPLRPLRLLELVGPPVALHVAETLHRAFPGRFPVPASLRGIAATGVPAGETEGAAPGDGAPSDGAPHAQEVRARVLAALAEETRLLLDEGVVGDPRDVDMCLVLGAGWPFHLGGLTPYLDRTGVSEQVTGRRFLPPGLASLPRP